MEGETIYNNNKLQSVGFIRYPGLAEYYIWLDFLLTDNVIKMTLN